MSDRSSARVFATAFRLLAEHSEVPQVREIAAELFEETEGYDFTVNQMDCDGALEALGIDLWEEAE